MIAAVRWLICGLPASSRPRNTACGESSKEKSPIFLLIPQLTTMCRASSVAVSRSFWAPVVIDPRANCSAALPPSAIAMLASKYSSDRLCLSSVGIDWVTPSAVPRGTLVVVVGRAASPTAFALVEAVHPDQQLVHRMLALVVAAAKAGAARASAGVKLADEDHRRRVLLAIFEKAANTRSADADEHLAEL